ncbi:MAG: tannase/feruloyl esterase family alpha/beta hydrolase [Gammaproteobacteria bacterium]|nr:tannase/feruloyl esterase family alpha/beta hydrolase [Gammaproteobacteria bacterium]
MKPSAALLPRMVLPGLLLLSGPTTWATTPGTCAALTALRLEGVALQIGKAVSIAAGPAPALRYGPPIEMQLPAHCRVEGVLDPRTGRNGRPYAIGFALALPDDWNGRFLFQGGGGLNGSVGEPLGWQASGAAPALARGFAVVSTDSGHQGAVFDATFMEDQQAALDFLYQATAKVTVVARQILERYYGRPAAHSYYVGCSTGGREAMMMSQRHPGYFDGIVAGAPAMRTGLSNLAMRSARIAFNRAAPHDAQGQPQGPKALSDSDRRLIVAALLDSCDALDGTRDGMIFATRACRFDPGVLQCRDRKSDTCLSAQQVTAVREAFAGPKDSHGNAVYPSYPYDTGINASGPDAIPGFLMSAPGPVGGSDVATTLDVDAAARAVATPIAAVGDTADWTNLSSFAAHGGKLLFYHGMSDPWFSANDTTQYYERLQADNGGREAVAGWSRLFLVPGMGHCQGGAAALDRFDMLSAIVAWVENGRAPEALIATGRAYPGRSRPLCPYPAHAQHVGSGDPESAASYQCRE